MLAHQELDEFGILAAVAVPSYRDYVMRSRLVEVTDALSDTRVRLEQAYAWLNTRLVGGEWAAGPDFSMADCAAAPALFYADWVQPIDTSFSGVRALRRRLLRRPSFARIVDEARPFRQYFPLGAPDQD